MAMYATISHKHGEKHEYVSIYKYKKHAMINAERDTKKRGFINSKVYRIRGEDIVGYLRLEFEAENLRSDAQEIASFEAE